MQQQRSVRVLALAMAATALLAGPSPARAQSRLAEVAYGLVAPGTAGWPLILAQTEGHSLKLDDFSIVLGGNSDQRFAGLASGNVQGAMLTQPYDFVAESKGNRILGTASDTMKNWLFNCIMANPDWAQKNRPLVVKFLRGLRRGMQFGYAHKAASVEVLVAQAHIDPAIAAHAWDVDFGQWKAYDPSLKLSPSAIAAVGAYQVSFGVIPALPPMNQLYDPSFAAEAIR